MQFHQIEAPGLSHYSYFVGCDVSKTAAVIDPKRDIDTYTSLAGDLGMTITHVLETHIHADYASGAYELAQATGAELGLSVYDDGEDFDVSFPHRELREGEIGRAHV